MTSVSARTSAFALLAQRDVNVAAGQPFAGEFELEVDDVVDEDDFVDQQIGQFQVAHRLLAADGHGEQRNAFAAGGAGGVGQAIRRRC